MSENRNENNIDQFINGDEDNHLLAEEPQLIQENNSENQSNPSINDELSEIQENEIDSQFSKKVKKIIIVFFPSLIFVSI